MQACSTVYACFAVAQARMIQDGGSNKIMPNERGVDCTGWCDPTCGSTSHVLTFPLALVYAPAATSRSPVPLYLDDDRVVSHVCNAMAPTRSPWGKLEWCLAHCEWGALECGNASGHVCVCYSVCVSMRAQVKVDG